MATTTVTLTSAWTQVGSGASNVIIQLMPYDDTTRAYGAVVVNLASAEPAAGAYGIVLEYSDETRTVDNAGAGERAAA